MKEIQFIDGFLDKNIESKNIAYELIQEAKESINSINKETKFLSDLADYIIDREY